MWNLKNTSEQMQQNRNKFTDTEDKLVVTSGERKGGGAKRGRRLRGTNYYV